MNRWQARVLSIGRFSDSAHSFRVACPAQAIPEPGQAILALRLGSQDFYRRTLFPAEILPDGFSCPAPPGSRYLPGDRLDIFGPVGRGFRPPAESRRWLLMAFDSQPAWLWPLLMAAARQQAAVAWFSDPPVANLPSEVEILDTPEPGLEWADYAAITLPVAHLVGIRSGWGRFAEFPIPCPAEVLLPDQLVCGFGGCMCCGLNTASGWSLRCQDGPVFDWEQLHG